MNSGYLCDAHEGSTCTIGGQLTHINCGTITEWSACYESTTLPPGEPFQTPNHCYCTGTTTVTTNTCNVAQCAI
jgi:hypothetical protein